MRAPLPLIVAAIAFVFCAEGCVTQRLDLVYEKSVRASGGSGEIWIAKPIELHGLVHAADGSLIIGEFRNVNGELQANVVTKSSVSDWVAGALIQELAAAGYTPKPVTSLPENAPKGLETTISRLWVQHEATTWGSAAPSQLHLEITIVKNGVRTNTLEIAAKGDYSKTSMNFARQKAMSLKKALQVALEQAVPEIIKTLENPREERRP